ncbi:MAG: hypothetical protein DLM50_02105 [Candidatus Meridianibacter frigidus]|nr:MAG: hypothetical protein DLM50_02105 [Candidatus Eremiobacteraeota bacterium]
MKRLSVSLLFLAGFAVIPACALAQENLRVATFAGSGVAGFKDGPLASAQFLFPTALAQDESGNIYVADTGAQRIRVISKDGIVRTLAGSGEVAGSGLWVPGGYRDGPAVQAQFNAPSGLAVTKGGIFVADTYTSVIRRIGSDGMVSTYAGTPFKAGMQDGLRTAALFSHPIGMAADREGNIFIADLEGGLREIDAAGTVSTVPLATERPLAVAVYESKRGKTIFVADARGLLIHFPDGKSKRITAPIVVQTGSSPLTQGSDEDAVRGTQGDIPIGYPISLAAINEHAVVYSDSRTHTVRLLDDAAPYTYSRLLGGQATDVAPESSGGFADGGASQSLFDAPLGVLYDHGAVVVADSGNKRIRKISGLDLRGAILATSQDMNCSPNSRSFQIAYVGNSIIWWDTDWAGSIPGQLEAAMNAGAGSRRYVVTPVQFFAAELDAVTSYLELLTEMRCYHAVVFSVNSGTFGSALGNTPGAFAAPATRLFLHLRAAFEKARIPLLVVDVPTHFDLGPSEATWIKVPQAALTPIDWDQSVRAILGDSGIDYISLWPSFTTDIRSPSHKAIYGSVDAHLTQHGRDLVAHEVIRGLTKLLAQHGTP